MLPVGLVTAGAIYIVLWWIALFLVLPIGVRNLAEAGETALGHETGAPARPMLARKAIWASGLAGVLWAVTMLVIAADPFSVR
jgi:predicted secreted protein